MAASIGHVWLRERALAPREEPHSSDSIAGLLRLREGTKIAIGYVSSDMRGVIGLSVMLGFRGVPNGARGEALPGIMWKKLDSTGLSMPSPSTISKPSRLMPRTSDARPRRESSTLRHRDLPAKEPRVSKKPLRLPRARDRKPEAAALAYVDLTLRCLSCHRRWARGPEMRRIVPTDFSRLDRALEQAAGSPALRRPSPPSAQGRLSAAASAHRATVPTTRSVRLRFEGRHQRPERGRREAETRGRASRARADRRNPSRAKWGHLRRIAHAIESLKPDCW
jgi:hypothetical protein